MRTTTPGSFIWFDLLTSDPQAAVDFYTHVIGWSTSPLGNDGTYTLFASDQGPLAGTTSLANAGKEGAQPHWTSNVQVVDVDETAAEAKRLGGRVVVAPLDAPNVGRIAVIADPFGSTLNVFAPSQTMEAREPYVHGEFTWCELFSENHPAAFAFYGALFGWKKSAEIDLGSAGTYLLYNNGGRDLGGMFTESKTDSASRWLYYVHVGDLESCVERAMARGARLLHGPRAVQGGGRIVQLADPHGAAFALHENQRPRG